MPLWCAKRWLFSVGGIATGGMGDELATKAVEHGVEVRPGRVVFRCDPGHHLRFAHSYVVQMRFVRIRRLGIAYRKLRGGQRGCQRRKAKDAFRKSMRRLHRSRGLCVA